MKWWGTWCRLDDGGGCGFVGRRGRVGRGEKETEITEKEVVMAQIQKINNHKYSRKINI